jgi:NhaP-type Na+/H+ or K+/H+ antiporter
MIKLPGIIGLLLLGVLSGPYVLGILNTETLAVSGDLRLMALVVILLRSGFEISKDALARVGGRAIMMAFIPCLCETAVVTAIAPLFLPLTYLEAAMLGSLLAAVSPAVVVPLMIKFIKEGKGEDKSIPTLVLAGASCDDAVAIVLSTSFIGMYVGESVDITRSLAMIPVSVITGMIVGLITGYLLYRFFIYFNPRATKRGLILLGLSIFLMALQKEIEHAIPFSGLLAIMSIGFIILEKCEKTAHEISSKLDKIWIFAQLLLFVLVGAQVNLPVAFNAGLAGALIIATGLVGRSMGVQICLFRSNLNAKERLFVTLSYLPKATVQAAIGGLPLTAMIASGKPTAPGEIILAVAVLSILLTAPLGAILITKGGNTLISQGLKEA